MKKILVIIISLLFVTTVNAKTLSQYEAEAENNNPTSAYKVALAYEFGIQGQVDKNTNKAIRYYLIAHKAGNLRATARLGVNYYDRRDYPEAIKYFKIGAAKGESLSQAYLGKILEQNNKIDSAIKFYRSSIKDQNPYGKMFLGEYLIKNSKKGSDEFLEGYALLVSANKKNTEAKNIINKYPYKFTKVEQEKILKIVNQYN
jgi:TPR repeat protein